MSYERLFTPGQIGKCKLKNRIIMAPMGNINMADPIGRPLPKMIDYFAERAKGERLSSSPAWSLSLTG